MVHDKSLSGLPAEIFDMVFDQIVLDIGMGAAVKLRQVCREFHSSLS
jgi:hypothetical protein